MIIGNQQSSTSLGERHFKIVGGLEADSKQRDFWWCQKKVKFQSVIKPSRAFLRFIVLKDWLWHKEEERRGKFN